MGCGSSSTPAAVTNSIGPQTRTNNVPEIVLPSSSRNIVTEREPSATPSSNKQRRIPSAESQHSTTKSIRSVTSQTSKQSRVSSVISTNNAAKRITSASSAATAKLSTGGKKSANPSIYSQSDVNQNLVIIWVDPQLDKNEKLYQDAITKLQRITNLLHRFTNADGCINCLETINDKTIVLIVSDRIGEQLIPLVFDKLQLEYIYVYNPEKHIRISWANKWAKKIKGIFHDMEQIFLGIKIDSGQMGSLTPISILPKKDIEIKTDGSNALDKTFMYTQLLKEILLDMEHGYEAKNTLVEYCRNQYADNDYQLGLIDEFAAEYDNHLAIQWYTKESFLYSMMNRALRSQDIETIMKMGFFISDLHKQIEKCYKEQNNQHTQITVHRGQGILKDDFDQLKNGIGGLLSFNNFLSTSIDANISVQFATRAAENPKVNGVLFTMNIDPEISSVPFAYLEGKSSFEYENEILFSMHTIFRVTNIQHIQDQYWCVMLDLTSDNDQVLKNLTDHFRKEFGEGTPLDRLGHLMLRLGEFNQAEEIFDIQLNREGEKTWRKQAHLNHQLGYVYGHKGEHKAALTYYNKALDMELAHLPEDDSSLAPTYNNIASVYHSMGDNASALSYYKKALEIETKFHSADHPLIATTYNNLGSVHSSLGDYAAALDYYMKTLIIREKSLPVNHPDFGTIYNNIGSAYSSLGDDQTALSYYQQTLELQENILPSGHIDLATSYGNIGTIYNSMGDHLKALEYHEKSLDIRKRGLPPYHPDTAMSYNNIGSVHSSMEDYKSALAFFQNSVEIRKHSFTEVHISFAQVYDNMGFIYKSMGDEAQALIYYQKVFDIRRTSLGENHPDMAYSYNNLGTMYSSMGEKSKALTYYEKALEIQR
ncbi:unnamed protein product, partial [Rotaria magnacalcarata]